MSVLDVCPLNDGKLPLQVTSCYFNFARTIRTLPYYEIYSLYFQLLFLATHFFSDATKTHRLSQYDNIWRRADSPEHKLIIGWTPWAGRVLQWIKSHPGTFGVGGSVPGPVSADLLYMFSHSPVTFSWLKFFFCLKNCLYFMPYHDISYGGSAVRLAGMDYRLFVSL